MAHGVLSLRQALTVSSDVFFYQLGRDLNEKGMPLQHWARELGLGRKTGIDLPEEGPGFVPGPKWRDREFAKFVRCKDRTNPTPSEIALGKCGWQDRPWSVGDNVNLSVGQGDLAANPLQMAVAYATIANGGRVLRPRLGQRIENSLGQAEQDLEAPTARRLKIAPENRAGDPRRPARRRERAGRHLDAGVRDLPGRHRRQDGHRREGRVAAPTSPGTSRSRRGPTRSTWWP